MYDVGALSNMSVKIVQGVSLSVISSFYWYDSHHLWTYLNYVSSVLYSGYNWAPVSMVYISESWMTRWCRDILTPEVLFWNVPQETLLILSCLLGTDVKVQHPPSFLSVLLLLLLGSCNSLFLPLLLLLLPSPTFDREGGAAVKSQWCHFRMWESGARWAGFAVSGVPPRPALPVKRRGAAKDDHRHRHQFKLRRALSLSSCSSDLGLWGLDLPWSQKKPLPPPCQRTKNKKSCIFRAGNFDHVPQR